MTGVLVRGGEVGGRGLDVLVDGNRIIDIGPDVRPTDAHEVVDAGGGAVVPGLHDHHLHLLAMAAVRASLDVSVEVSAQGFDRSVASSDRERVVGYHEHHHGPLDRERLDRLGGGRPLRVQHASGAAWVLSSAAGAGAGDDGWRFGPGTIEPDPTERDLASIGADLAAVGVTGCTDATPFDDPVPLGLITAAGLPQTVIATGGLGLVGHAGATGPVKLVLADHEVPDPTALAEAIRRAHDAGRPVAVHCVTATALALLLAAWDEVGAHPGDRVEHAAVVPDSGRKVLADLGVTVVTQPNFVRERGDRYLAEVDDGDRPDLWRCGTLIAAGVPVAAGTDAPFGRPDPWVAMAAAVERRTGQGADLGPAERIEPARALDLFLGPLEDPGGAPRRVGPGAAADLCVLDRPLAAALEDLAAVAVRVTIAQGRIVHAR